MISALTLQGKLLAGGVVITLIVALILLGNAKLNAIKAEAYQAGVTACQADAQEALTKANEANAKASTDLQSTINEQARRIAQLSAQRQGREQTIATKIDERLVDQPNCQITPDLLALRNQIRAQ